jgi:hypothetical protein
MRSAATWMTWCYMEGSMCKVYFDEHIHSFGWGLVYCSWSYSPRTKWVFSLDETARDLVLCLHTLVWGRRMENLRLLTGWTGRGGGTHMPFNMNAWIYLSRHVAHLISLPFCSDHEWMSWTLVSRLMHCAMVIPLVQLNVWVEETNMGFGVHHQFVGNYVVMRYWWWVLIAITSCCSFRFCLFWQSGGWTLGLIQHRGRSSQVSESCMSSCCSSHTAAWIKFFFSFRMILVLIKPLA